MAIQQQLEMMEKAAAFQRSYPNLSAYICSKLSPVAGDPLVKKAAEEEDERKKKQGEGGSIWPWLLGLLAAGGIGGLGYYGYNKLKGGAPAGDVSMDDAANSLKPGDASGLTSNAVASDTPPAQDFLGGIAQAPKVDADRLLNPDTAAIHAKVDPAKALGNLLLPQAGQTFKDTAKSVQDSIAASEAYRNANGGEIGGGSKGLLNPEFSNAIRAALRTGQTVTSASPFGNIKL